MSELMTSAGPLDEVETARRDLDQAMSAESLARVRFEAALVQAVQAGIVQREVAGAGSVSQPFVSQIVQKHAGRFVPSSPLGRILAARRGEVIALARTHGVDELAVFGSVARGDDGPESDIDLAGHLPESMGLLGLARLEAELSTLLGARVDLSSRSHLRPPVARTAEHDLVPL